ncbi:MAG TPA: LysR family transcriptional regulator [Nitrospiria bacterium]|nr:LysR family transcriptional regulator [Nitrospiria bacterium]
MTLDQLKTFLAVAETGSLRAAGEKCHISQPAVTRQLQLLEESLGASLLFHHGRGVRLTPAGLVLRKRGVRILREIETSIKQVQAISGIAQNQIQIGVSHYAAVYLLPPLILSFRKKDPETHLIFQYGTSEEIIERVKDGHLTFGIGTTPKKTEKLIQIPLWTDAFKAILPRDHPLATAKDISLRDLAGMNLVLPEKGTTTRYLIEQAFKKEKIFLNPVMEVTYLETIKASVKMGIGASILPGDMFSEADSDRKYFSIKSIKGSRITRQLGLVYKRGRKLLQHELDFLTALKP